MKFLHAYAAAAGWQLAERDILAMAALWPWEKLRCNPPIEPGQPLRALAVAAPYAGDKIYKYLVKRVSHRDLIAVIKGDGVEAL
jgi:hypothetical protein